MTQRSRMILLNLMYFTVYWMPFSSSPTEIKENKSFLSDLNPNKLVEDAKWTWLLGTVCSY